MKKKVFFAALLCLAICSAGCSADKDAANRAGMESGQEASVTLLHQGIGKEDSMEKEQGTETSYTINTKIVDVLSDPVFGEYGRLIFPVDSGYYSGDTLGGLCLTWYNNIDPEKTVEIANYMKDHAAAGNTIFYDIYTEMEKEKRYDEQLYF